MSFHSHISTGWSQLTPSASTPSPMTAQPTTSAPQSPTVSQTLLVPPGVSLLPQSSSTPYTHIPAMPYGFAPFNPYSAFDLSLAMSL